MTKVNASKLSRSNSLLYRNAFDRQNDCRPTASANLHWNLENAKFHL